MKTKIYLLFIFFFVLNISFAQNYSVGINTLSPNQNAVLELISPNNNQGLLVPKLTTLQRTSIDFQNNLSLIDDGLLVYDTDYQLFFWWNGSDWTTFSGGSSFIAGEGIDINSGVISNILPDQIVTLQQSGSIEITGTYPNFTISATDLVDDADSDPTNELEIPDYSASSGMFLSNDGTNLNWVENAEIDGDITNEIQTLSLTGTDLTLSLGGGTVSINDADFDPLNELEIPDYSASSGMFLTNDGTNLNWVENTEIDGDITNEIQILSLTGTDLTLSLGGGTVSINDADSDPLNEIEIPDYSASSGMILSNNGTNLLWENQTIYNAGTGINIDALNNINSLWTTSGADIMNANSASNVGIGGAPLSSYKLYVNGRFQSLGVNELSDERYKTNIETIANSLEIVQNLRGVNYEWNIENFPDKNFEEGTQIGFIAQEVEEVIPYIVDTDENGYKSVEYSHLVALLVEAIKEQQIIIEEQQKEIEQLKTSNTEVLDKFSSIENSLEIQQKQINLLMKYMESSNTVQATDDY